MDIGDRDAELRAIAELSKAVEIDPGYVNAWVGLADAYDSAATDNVSPRTDSYRLARLAVDKALALDPNDADAYAMRAFIRMNLWDWTGAEDDIHRSLRLRKTSGAVQAGAKLAIARGNLLEAEALLRGVLATDPLDTYTLSELAYAVYPRLGRFEDSDRLFSKLRDINANGLYINAYESLNAVFEGKYDLALRLAESETDAAQREMALTIVYTAMGKTLPVASCGGAHLHTPNSSPASSSEVGDTVLALDRAWGQAYVTGDIEFVDRILSPDWRSWTDHEGSDKATELAEFRSGRSRSLENIIDNARVRVYGDAVVVEARERVRFRDADGEHWLTWHITDVFIHRSAGW